MSATRAWVVLIVLATVAAADGRPFEERTEWVMGTTLRVVLPVDLDDRDEIFRDCFATARRWDAWLSPWQSSAPLTRLSAGAGAWVVLPDAVINYLERAKRDAVRTGHVFDITLAWQGSVAIAIDRAGSRAMLPEGSPPLDPGGDGKGVALDAMAAILDAAGVPAALIDFGGSSFLARGAGPGGDGWQVALTGPDGEDLGVLTLRDSALGVSSSVQRDHGEDGTVVERWHLRDLRTGKPVRARRTAAVVSSSATDAEVLSTAAAIAGRGVATMLDGFPGCALGLFDADGGQPLLHGGFPDLWRRGPAGTDP